MAESRRRCGSVPAQMCVSPGGPNGGRYGHSLRTNPVLTVIEIWLALAFVAHTLAALLLTRQDKKLEMPPRFSWAKVRLPMLRCVRRRVAPRCNVA